MAIIPRSDAVRRAQAAHYQKNKLKIKTACLDRYHASEDYKVRDRSYQQRKRDMKRWLIQRSMYAMENE